MSDPLGNSSTLIFTQKIQKFKTNFYLPWLYLPWPILKNNSESLIFCGPNFRNLGLIKTTENILKCCIQGKVIALKFPDFKVNYIFRLNLSSVITFR